MTKHHNKFWGYAPISLFLAALFGGMPVADLIQHVGEVPPVSLERRGAVASMAILTASGRAFMLASEVVKSRSAGTVNWKLWEAPEVQRVQQKVQ